MAGAFYNNTKHDTWSWTPTADTPNTHHLALIKQETSPYVAAATSVPRGPAPTPDPRAVGTLWELVAPARVAASVLADEALQKFGYGIALAARGWLGNGRSIPVR